MTADLPTDVPASGWFPDPNVPGQERWWDGAAWGEQIRPKPTTSSTAPRAFELMAWVGSHRMITAVIVGAVLLAIVVGVVATRQNGSYNRAAFEQGLMQSMNEEIDFTRIQKVQCPDSPSLAQGSSFECLASGIDGSNLAVTVTIQDDEGGYIWRTS